MSGDLTNAMLQLSTNPITTVTAYADTAPTMSAAEVFGGLVTGVPTAARTYTLGTAAALLALCSGAIVGSARNLVVKNQSTTGFNITLAASASITNGGVASDLTIHSGQNAKFKIVFTNVTSGSEAAVIYREEGSITLTRNASDGQSPLNYRAAPGTINTTAAATAAQVIGGIITSTTAAAVSITMPAATALLALMPGAIVGSVCEVVVKNLGATNAITVVDSGDITNGGSTADLTIAANTNGTFIVRCTATGTPTFSYYRK